MTNTPRPTNMAGRRISQRQNNTFDQAESDLGRNWDQIAANHR